MTDMSKKNQVSISRRRPPNRNLSENPNSLRNEISRLRRALNQAKQIGAYRRQRRRRRTRGMVYDQFEGDYTLYRMPAAFDGTFTPAGQKHLVMRNTEIVGNLTSVNSTLFIPLNPAFWDGTNVSATSKFYTQYKPLQIECMWSPNVATTQSGRIQIYSNWGTPLTDVQLQHTPGYVTSPIYAKTSTRIPLSGLTQRRYDMTSVQENGIPAFIGIKATGTGISPAADEVEYGQILVRYSYDLYNFTTKPAFYKSVQTTFDAYLTDTQKYDSVAIVPYQDIHPSSTTLMAPDGDVFTFLKKVAKVGMVILQHLNTVTEELQAIWHGTVIGSSKGTATLATRADDSTQWVQMWAVFNEWPESTTKIIPVDTGDFLSTDSPSLSLPEPSLPRILPHPVSVGTLCSMTTDTCTIGRDFKPMPQPSPGSSSPETESTTPLSCAPSSSRCSAQRTQWQKS